MVPTQNQNPGKGRRPDDPEPLDPKLGRIAAPEELGRAGSDFIAYMVQAAQDYFVRQAVTAVKAGFDQGLTENETDSQGDSR